MVPRHTVLGSGRLSLVHLTSRYQYGGFLQETGFLFSFLNLTFRNQVGGGASRSPEPGRPPHSLKSNHSP